MRCDQDVVSRPRCEGQRYTRRQRLEIWTNGQKNAELRKILEDMLVAKDESSKIGEAPSMKDMKKRTLFFL